MSRDDTQQLQDREMYDSPTADADDLGDDLFRVAMETTDDGRVNAEITAVRGIGKVDGRYIEVEYRLPSMRELTERMDYPERDTDDYKFVRLCRAAGYSLASAEQLEGAEVKAEQDDGEWFIHAPRTPTRRERLWRNAKRTANGGYFIVGYALYPVAAYLSIRLDDDRSLTAVDKHSLLMTSALWLLVVALVYLIVTIFTAPASPSGGAPPI